MAKEQTVIDEGMDRRIIERKLMHGQMTDRELKKFLAKLPDVSANAEQVVIEMDRGPSGSVK